MRCVVELIVVVAMEGYVYTQGCGQLIDRIKTIQMSTWCFVSDKDIGSFYRKSIINIWKNR